MKQNKKYKKGNIVKEMKFGILGMIEESYTSWDDLKRQQLFLTIDSDNESSKMDEVEKIINGDPRDAWLEAQEIPFTDEQLKENWYTIRCFNGGEILCCESLIKMVDNALN